MPGCAYVYRKASMGALMLALVPLVILSSGCLSGGTPSDGSVCIGKDCFSVEVAYTPQERETGLMYREHLDPGSGMLFVFESEDVYMFWMKNTLIPLDMIWMDKGGRVTYIAHDVQPCVSDPCPSYGPPGDSLFVLELNAGSAAEHGIEVGDEAVFDLN